MRIKCFLLLALVCVSFAFAACEGTNDSDGKISVVCTAFPQYDWVRNIIGEKSDIFNITYITDKGVDMHSYQPTAEDIITIADCDIIISVGGTSEKWIDDAVRNNYRDGRFYLKLTDMLGDSVMTIGTDSGKEHSHSFDEHVWLSLRNAALFCEKICSALSEKNPENAEYYQKNTARYIEDLLYVDSVAAEFIVSSPRDTVIMADRFPFRYTLHDYGIKYYAAFDGCSSDSEVTFDTVIQLAAVIDSMDIKAVLVTDDSDGRIAEAIISNTKNKDIQIYMLDAMQSVSDKDIENGMTYIEVMRDNLAFIHGALIA